MLRPPKGGTELDQWIISLLNHTIASVNAKWSSIILYKVVPLLVDFIDNLTNWYIRRSRRRFWKSENDQDKDCAYSTLYYVLVEFSKVMAPFLPYLTEAIYRNLVVGKIEGAPESVHLNPFPKAQTGKKRTRSRAQNAAYSSICIYGTCTTKPFYHQDTSTVARIHRHCSGQGKSLHCLNRWKA